MEFVSVRTATIRPGTKLLFDVYVYFKDNHIKYRSCSEMFEENILLRLKTKKVKKLFIPVDQEPSYLKYLDQALDQLADASATVGSKAEFAQDTLKQEAENVQKTLESEEAYKGTEMRIQKVVDFMLNEPKALAGMLASAGLSVDDSSHGSSVSSLALGVGTFSKKLGREELTDLAIAGLLHDTGLERLGFNAKTDFRALSKDEKTSYKKHPAIAVELVAGKKFITPRVLRLIQDHEEYGDGQGYPEKKRMAKLQFDSQVFNLCDAFDHYCIQQSKTAVECIEGFITERAEHFSIESIEMLEKKVKA